MKYERYKKILISEKDRVLTLMLNRPGSFNAVDSELHTELSNIFADVAQDAAVDVVLLTGAGSSFCAGGDLKWFCNITSGEMNQLMREARKIILDLCELPQPIIAAVNGPAVGLGATLALFCDMVYMAEDAKLSDPHVRVGVTAGDGGAVIWPLLTSMVRAKEYLLTGNSVSASEAERIGLVNRVVGNDMLMEETMQTARYLANGSRDAIRSTKFVMNKHIRDAVNLILDTSLALEKECFQTDFHRAAIKKFASQR